MRLSCGGETCKSLVYNKKVPFKNFKKIKKARRYMYGSFKINY